MHSSCHPICHPSMFSHIIFPKPRMFFPFDQMLKCYASFKSQLEKVFSDPQRWSLPLWFNSILGTYCYYHLCQSIVEFVLLLLSPLLWMAKGLQFKDSSITYLGDFGQITLLPSPDIFFCKRNTDITFPQAAVRLHKDDLYESILSTIKFWQILIGTEEMF